MYDVDCDKIPVLRSINISKCGITSNNQFWVMICIVDGLELLFNNLLHNGSLRTLIMD